MSPAPAVDRRQHKRHPLAMSLEIQHSASGRTFPGRCVDVSLGGLKLHVPATAPIKAGDRVLLTLGNVARPDLAELAPGPRQARIVRIDRWAILTLGHAAVGMQFISES